MDRNVPAGAAILLDFIGETETARPDATGYDTIFGHNERKLPKPLTTMTLDEVIGAGPSWTKAYRSSAAGRYQFMNATLKGLKKELGLRGTQTFDANLQDRLGFHLLKRRGYEAFMAGKLSAAGFGKALAQEWASFPVLVDTKGQKRDVARGQSFYAGDGLNKALVKPAKVESVLALAKQANAIIEPPPSIPVVPLPAPEPKGRVPIKPIVIGVAVLALIGAFFFVRF